MFEKRLAAQLKRIFDFDKVTYDAPGESEEQEGLFIVVESVRARVIDARQIAKVQGSIRIFAQAEKLPYGYLAKQLGDAPVEAKQGLYFFNPEENRGTYRNIHERSMAFVYLFDSQFDPAIGTLDQVNFNLPGDDG